MVGLSHQAVNLALGRLEECGLVDAQPAGRAYLYSLNREHIFVQHGFDQLLTAFVNWPLLVGRYYMEHLPIAPQAILLFGSYARGQATAKSDLDLLLVYMESDFGSQRLDEVIALNAAVQRLCGIAPAPMAMSTTQFRTDAQSGQGLVPNIVREGRSIAGHTITELLQP